MIQQALHEPHVDHQPDTASTCAADLSGLSPLKRRLNQMMDGFREIEDSPKIQQVYTGTKPKSKESTPTNIVSTWVNSVVGFWSFLHAFLNAYENLPCLGISIDVYFRSKILKCIRSFLTVLHYL